MTRYVYEKTDEDQVGEFLGVFLDSEVGPTGHLFVLYINEDSMNVDFVKASECKVSNRKFK